MKKYLLFIFLITALAGCSAKKPVSNLSSYYNVPPNLSNIVYEGGDGKTIENAIIIKNAENSRNGIAAEYAYIAKQHGERFKDWKPLGQALRTLNNKSYDVINIEIASNNEKITYYFDISDFFGKF